MYAMLLKEVCFFENFYTKKMLSFLNSHILLIYNVNDTEIVQE